MASSFAPAPPAPNQQHEGTIDALAQSTSYSESQVNGIGGSDEAAANASGFSGNATLPATGLEEVSAKVQPISSTSEANPAGPTPVVDEVAPGIQPIADFVPKDASTLSHPTPPPDEPLSTGVADVDTEMANTESDAPPPVISEAATPSPPEQSLVRPREDDGEDEPAAKRTRVDDDIAAAQDEIAPVVAAAAPELTDAVTQSPAGGDEQMQVEVDSAAAVPMEDVDQDAHGEPMESVVPESTAASVPVVPTDAAAADVKVEATQQETQTSDANALSTEVAASEPTVPETQADVKPLDTSAESQAEAPATPNAPAPAAGSKVQASTAPMTQYQKASLIEKMKNLKKTKHSIAFLRPVDFAALNIPTYPDIVKQPMDLGTMDKKLKGNEYGSVREFVDDFELIVANVRKFNGDQHAVTQSGFNMKAYFDRMLETVPSADQAPPSQKSQKKRSPSITQEPKRREQRAAAAPAPPPAPIPAQAAAPTQQGSFALQSDGTPQIRRASSNVRPARAIKPPQNREIPYAKPRRKEHLLELKFSEHVLDEIRSAKYGNLNHVFQLPVDPVALNIPNYHQVIKQPMDISLMVQKMKSGQYGTAAEFKKDFELMVRNCMTFNPVGNPVRDLAIAFQRQFESLWSEKSKWEKRNAPASTRASSASAEGDSEEEEDEEEAETNPNDIEALKKQIAMMQSTLETMSGGGTAGKARTKPAKSHKKGASKKTGGASTAPTSKAAPKASKPKRERMITYEEKDEISKAVERMDEKQIGRLTEIITRECPKYRDMEEMELEIDDLPNTVQLMLLRYVRDIFGGPKKKAAPRDYSPDDVAAQDDDDFEPRKGGAGAGGRGGGGKRKKHAPMSKMQQEEQLRALQGKLQEFSNAATSGSESPAASNYNQQNAQPESSGDEDSEESEEE